MIFEPLHVLRPRRLQRLHKMRAFAESRIQHVSGIVAAQLNNPYGIIGAATGVELGMYRVFGCAGSSADDVLIAGFNSECSRPPALTDGIVLTISQWHTRPEPMSSLLP